jgi:hypothetical protein
MATLTAKKRKALPASEFAGPDRSYPVNNRSHAANAKSRDAQGVKKGTLSASAAARINRKADRILGE